MNFFYLKRYALKTLCGCERTNIDNEIKLMQMFDHPHIVKYYGEFMHSIDICCIVIELCEVYV